MKRLALSALIALSMGSLQAQVRNLDPVITQALHQVSTDSIEHYIQDLVGFHTRHNLSTQTDPKQGLGAAMKYLQARCQAWAQKAANRPAPVTEMVRYDTGGEKTRLGRKVNLPNVMVTLPGTQPDGELILLAHVDTRIEDNSDGTSFAPGANDDGSGVARNTRVNMAAIMNLAQAAARPQNAVIANANALSNFTELAWDAVESTDGQAVSYEILYRETDQSTWQVYQTCAPQQAQRQTCQVPLSKDNFFFAVRSVTAQGHASLPALCR